jgi:hypothetical protein
MTTALQDYWDKLGKLRCPIGLMLFKAEQYDTVADVAARSGATLVDFRDPARAMIPAGGRYVDFRPDTLFKALRNAHDSSPSHKMVVKNFDLGLARLKVADRNRLWETLVNNFPPNSNTAVVLAMPDEQTAMHLLPTTETLRQWFDSKRALRIASG